MTKMVTVCFVRLKEPWRADPYSDPPLGLLSVIGATKNISHMQRPLDIRLLDMAHETKIPRADVYALSGCTLDFPELIKIAKRIKDERGGLVIAGGPHFDVIPEDIWLRDINTLPIDTICRGEGEHTFPRAIETIGDRTKRVISQTGPLLDLDTLPLPAREFLDRAKYFRPGRAFNSGAVYGAGNSSTMMTSRGCPFVCSFCASPEIHRRRVRYISIDRVAQELKVLQTEYGVNEIRFQDDCFTLNPNRFKQMAVVLANSGIRYRCSIRVDQADTASLNLLWNSGCREVGFGIESAEDNVLRDSLRKKTTVAQNRYALIETKRRGFKTRAFIMTGVPGETKDSAGRMIAFLEETKPDVVTLTSFIPLPGCDIYNHPERYGVTIIDRDWANYNIAIRLAPGAPFVHRIETATFDEMERNREMLKEFLFNQRMSNVAAYNQSYSSPILAEQDKK